MLPLEVEATTKCPVQRKMPDKTKAKTETMGDASCALWDFSDRILRGALDLRHVFRSKKVLVFNAMEDITNDEYLARS